MQEGHWWLLMDGGLAVGFASLEIYYYLVGWPAFLSLSGIIPMYRGQGLQKKLIRVRERMARKIDCGRIVTYSSYDNYASANNLINCGYRLYLPQKEWGIAGGYYFRKILRTP